MTSWCKHTVRCEPCVLECEIPDAYCLNAKKCNHTAASMDDFCETAIKPAVLKVLDMPEMLKKFVAAVTPLSSKFVPKLGIFVL